MDPPESAQDSRLCTDCAIERRTLFVQTNSHCKQNSPPTECSQTSHFRGHSRTWHSGSLKSALNVRWPPLLQWSLLVILLLRAGLAEATCRTGQPHVGYFPAASDEQIKLQHSTMAQDCADLCCDKKYCDLAWIVADDCFHARCLTEEDCIPLPATDEDSVVYVMDRSQHSQSQGGFLPCNPYDTWDPCPANEYCKINQCVCNSNTVRNPATGLCEPRDTETLAASDSSDLFGVHGGGGPLQSEDPYPRYGDADFGEHREGGVDEAEAEGALGHHHHHGGSSSDRYPLCRSDHDCHDMLEICIGLEEFGEGICKCMSGFRLSEEMETCLPEISAGELITPSSVSQSTVPSTPVPSTSNAPTSPPNTSPKPLVETAGETSLEPPPNTTDVFPAATTLPSILAPQSKEDVDNKTGDAKAGEGGGTSQGVASTEGVADAQGMADVQGVASTQGMADAQGVASTQGMAGAQGVVGAKGVAVTDSGVSKPDDEVGMPDKKNGDQVSGQSGDQSKTVSAMGTSHNNTTLAQTNPPDNLTPEGATQTGGVPDTLTEKDIDTATKLRESTETSGEPTQAAPKVAKLTVSAGEDKTLQLPEEDGVSLIAYVIPEKPPKGQEYSYDWQVLESPDDSRPGKMVGEHARKLQLDELSAGMYRFKVEVQGENSYGSATVNVTVLAPPRVNVAPKAVINPPSQEVILPNPDTFLDGSDSTDDDKIVSYQWEEVEGPVRETKITGDTQTLKLTNLVPGSYVIRLTVTDSDGVTDSALANVTVKEEIDNPPVAKAGKDVIIKLPINSAVLYGNSSFDDHPGLVYEWSKVSGPVADMSGSSSPILHLNNLDEGTYVFRLTLTDSKNQKDSDEATVIVKPENNLPPTANAGPDKELSLPDDATTLNGGGSTDDLAVTSYLWEKISGPNDPDIKDDHSAVATVSGLVGGHYIFKLTVGDEQGAINSDTVQVVVKKEFNNPPVANAGPDKTINLPNDVVELDGSGSSDDKGIVSYEWKRSATSPAAGTPIENSAHEPILKMKGLVAGIYHMTLNVTDAKGASNTDVAMVTVQEDPHRLNLVEITFDIPVSKFSEQDKIDMARSLAVLLSVRDEDTNIQQVYQTPNEQLQVIFYAINATSKTAIPGPTVVKILKKKKLSSETDLLKYRVLEVDTMICQKNCSGHGECNQYTKLCMCESFWMENYIRTWFGDGESNCDWSILYVIVVACVVAIAIGGLCWICICCIKRSRRKVKRRRRYNLLSQDLDGTESMEMLPKNGNGNVLDKLTDKGSFQGKQSSSIMISESDDDTDDETTLFDSKKRLVKNGKANGSVATAPSRKKRPFPLISARTDKL